MRPFATILLSLVVLVVGTGCILNVTSYRDRGGSLVYVGEAYNEGGPLSNPQVVGTFYDANGNVIATQSGSVCQVLPNKGLAAFEVRLPAGTPDPARVEWKLEGNPVDDVRLATDLSVQVTNTVTGGNGFTSVFGDLRNNGTNTYINGYVCASWVNDRGEVLRVARSTAAGLSFGPGQVLPFQLIAADVPAEAVGMRFYLDAGYPLQNDLPEFLTLAGSAYVNESTDRLTGPGGTFAEGYGEIRNTTSGIIAPSVSAVVRDSAGKLIGVSGGPFCPSAVPPGGVGYGGWLIRSPATSMPDPQIKVEAVKAPDAVILETQNVSLGGATVTGRVRNASSSTVRAAVVCAALYNDSGEVIGVNYTVLRDLSLAPGGSTPFEVFVVPRQDAVEAKAIASGVE